MGTVLLLAQPRAWPVSRWLVAIAVAAVAAVLMGVPTGIIHTSLYSRMTPVLWWNYPVWAASAVLVGLTAATYVRARGTAPDPVDRSRRTLATALLSTFAIGCPICNKLVVGLIGVSGALSYWAPLQPVLGLLSVGLLLAGLGVRLRAERACPVASHPAVDAELGLR